MSSKNVDIANFPETQALTQNILKDDGSINPSRLPTAADARGVYLAFFNADVQANYDRAAITRMYDGYPPYDEGDRAGNGQANTSNINFGDALAQKESAKLPYLDLLNSVPCLFHIGLKRSWAMDDGTRMEWEGIIAEELHRMCKLNTGFDFKLQLLSDFFITQGVGISYWGDAYNPFWQVTHLGEYFTAHNVQATEDSVDVSFCVRYVTPGYLYQYIKDGPEEAAKNGWDYDAVKDAIIHYSLTDPQTTRMMWEEIEERIKANDLNYTYARSQVIKIGFCWVKEYDEKVSLHILLPDVAQDEYLYSETRRFDKIQNCFVYFLYGVGNGLLHSIRGQGYKMFPQIQALNQLKGKALDIASFASTMYIQPRDQKALDEMDMTTVGPFTIFPPIGAVDIKPIQMPNVGNSAMPVIQMMLQNIQSNTGSYIQPQQNIGRQPATLGAEKIDEMNRSQLTSGAMSLFYNPLSRLLREMVRRVSLFNIEWWTGDPGGHEVEEFYRRITDRGVPIDAMRNIEDVDAVRAVGFGSAANRAMAHEKLLTLAGSMDPVGRNAAYRAVAAESVGWSNVDQYFPRLTTPRSTLDTQIANIENTELLKGNQIDVLPDQNHYVHLTSHFGKALPILQQLGGQQMAAEQAYTPLSALVPHCSQHLQDIPPDPSRQTQIKQFRQILSQFTNALDKIQQHLQAKAQAAAAEAAHNGTGGGQSSDPSAQQEAIQNQQTHQQNLQQQQQLMNLELQRFAAVTSARVQAIQAESKAKQDRIMGEGAQKLQLADMKNAQDMTQQTNDIGTEGD